MEPGEISKRIDENMVEAFRGIARASDNGEVHEWGGVVIAASGLPNANFNPAFITRPLSEPERVLAEVTAYFDSRGLPFVVRVREGLDPVAEAAGAKTGLSLGHAVPGMVMEDLSRLPGEPPGLEIRAATSAESIDAHIAVLVRGFDMPAELARALTDAGKHLPEVEMYVGYADGVPVASSLLYLSGRVAGVFNVATVPEARRRGFGEAMTWQAVRRGADMGAVIATLQATEMGRPVYERMGFRVDTFYQTLERAAEADA